MAFEKSCFCNKQRMLRLGSVRGEGRLNTNRPVSWFEDRQPCVKGQLLGGRES
jgi:hypothetical protein